MFEDAETAAHVRPRIMDGHVEGCQEMLSPATLKQFDTRLVAM
jgi:hypothetical protein